MDEWKFAIKIYVRTDFWQEYDDKFIMYSAAKSFPEGAILDCADTHAQVGMMGKISLTKATHKYICLVPDRDCNAV